jgi:uncharacterized protein (TIGR03083 family)
VSGRESVENLARAWASIDELCASLTEDEWKRPTALPGWSVQDNVAHLIDYESRALGRPAPDHTPVDLSHTRNPIGQANEVGVDYRRQWAGADVLAEFRDVMADRLQQLRGLSDADLAAPVDTPAGPGTLADMLNLRVMDTWTHEQDIRAAIDRPGHVEGPVVDQALSHFVGFLPYVVGKRAAAPDGTRVVVDIRGYGTVGIEVSGGRARRTDVPIDSPDVTLRTDVVGFTSLVNGRASASEVDVGVDGDEALGRAIVERLNVMV